MRKAATTPKASPTRPSSAKIRKPAKRPPSKAKPRSRGKARVGEQVSAPDGFGGVGRAMSFGDAISAAMLTSEGLDGVPQWWPADRLPTLRGKAARALEAACLEHFGISSRHVVACSVACAQPDLVRDVARFLATDGCRDVPWDSDDGMEASLATWRSIPVLILRSQVGVTHVVAPEVGPAL